MAEQKKPFFLEKKDKEALLESENAVFLSLRDPDYAKKRKALHHPDWILRHKEPITLDSEPLPKGFAAKHEYEIWEYIPGSEMAKKAHDFCNLYKKTRGYYPPDVAKKSFKPHEIMSMKSDDPDPVSDVEEEVKEDKKEKNQPSLAKEAYLIQKKSAPSFWNKVLRFFKPKAKENS